MAFGHDSIGATEEVYDLRWYYKRDVVPFEKKKHEKCYLFNNGIKVQLHVLKPDKLQVGVVASVPATLKKLFLYSYV